MLSLKQFKLIESIGEVVSNRKLGNIHDLGI